MIKKVIRYFCNIPKRQRRYWTKWYHQRIFIRREKRNLASYTTGITGVVDGQPAFPSGRYCCFVLFSPTGALPENVKGAIAAMRQNEINILACLNAPLTNEAMQWLRDNAHKVICRNNIGYDFGAYKDCVNYASAKFTDIDRFMFLNDSVFFIAETLADFFCSMMSNADVVSAFENWGDNAGNHFQSFAVTVSGAVFRSAPFRAFWKSYLPVSSRLWAIEEGEKKLSDAILNAAASSTVLYTCAALCQKLAEVRDDIILPDMIVPARYRKHLPANARREISLTTHYRALVDIVDNSSPIHCGAWLFPKFLGAPLVKKDIVYRQRFAFWEVQALFQDVMTETELSEFSTQIRAKGNLQKLDEAALTRYELGIG